MKYLVIELQENTDGTVGNIVTSYDDINKAESKWHSILASAAQSSIPYHSAVILTSRGTMIKSEYYEHMEAE